MTEPTTCADAESFAAAQGAVLTSSDRGGVRIQFSKNPFGKKRDYGGNYVQMPGDWGSGSSTYTAPAADAATTAAAPPGVAPGTGDTAVLCSAFPLTHCKPLHQPKENSPQMLLLAERVAAAAVYPPAIWMQPSNMCRTKSSKERLVSGKQSLLHTTSPRVTDPLPFRAEANGAAA